jgi:membrane-anchored protein YejM (alkaline phosphatase superfamily)
VDAFYGLQQRPVLIEELQRQGYEFALFAAPGFGPPTDLNRTVFAGIPGLPLERHDLGAGERNRAVTDSWLRWLDERRLGRTQPFFGFLYYDPPMAEMSADTDPALPLQGRFRGKQAREPWTQYRRAVQFADGELARVLDDLGARGLDETTLVIVFSDHGYEFDDYGNGTIGHASSFSPAQLRATLVIRWPGSEPALYPQRTAHQDVAPTLLAGALGCRNPPADYSSGGSLFDARGWDWIVAGSYGAHAIVQPGQVVVAHPGGFVEVLGPDYRPLAGAGLDSGVVGDALAEMRRFYR